MPKTTHNAQQQPTPDRRNDKLLTFEEIVERTRMPEATLRWLRHRGELHFVFKLGGRLVGWESDCLAYIEGAAAREQA